MFSWAYNMFFPHAFHLWLNFILLLDLGLNYFYCTFWAFHITAWPLVNEQSRSSWSRICRKSPWLLMVTAKLFSGIDFSRRWHVYLLRCVTCSYVLNERVVGAKMLFKSVVFLSSCLSVLHAILIMVQASTLNVAFNSHNKSLLTIMMSNNVSAHIHIQICMFMQTKIL